MKLFSKIKKHKKSIAALAFAAAISLAVYTDVLNLGKNTPVSDFLYNASYDEQKSKILGEATLVDSSFVENSEALQGDSYFAMATVNKEKSRSDALETLQVVVDSSYDSPETRDKALLEIMDIASYIETEASIEEMIKAKGFSDCVAIMNSEGINVIVKSDGLVTSEIAQITDIVKGETGFDAQRIKIVEKI